jgi:hypothetical protein
VGQVWRALRNQVAKPAKADSFFYLTLSLFLILMICSLISMFQFKELEDYEFQKSETKNK